MASLLPLVLGLLAGSVAGYFIRRLIAQKGLSGAEAKAERLLKDAKTKEQEILIAAQEKSLKLIDDAKREEESRRREIQEEKKRLESRESLFDKKLLEIEEKQQKIAEKVTQVENVKTEIQKLKDQEIQKLETISGLNRERAKEELLHRVEEESQDALTSRLRKLESQGVEELERKAKIMLSTVIQRIASSHAADVTTSTVELPSDEMKGRIIGKEGRNIKALERITGTDIIVDETPQAITVSAFSPIRRQVAKRAIEKLILDGRIHPGRIEEAVEEAKKDLAVDLRKAGEDALYQLGITGLDPKLIQVLGRLKYRTSYGQNVLSHSIEVANIATLIAQDLGADVTICKKGGLLHDIGKALDHDIKGTHPQIGYDLMKKFSLPEEVAYMSIAHHEAAPKTLEGIIVLVADAISGSRPGARRDSIEEYIKRLEDIERIATSFPGIEKSYAIQGGREVRVFVVPTEVNDLAAYDLAKNIARKIEEEIRYPGEIKVNVIRETRVTEYAR
ncbi:MAG: ribonuclease Y [Patescibacteria group bacterium]